MPLDNIKEVLIFYIDSVFFLGQRSHLSAFASALKSFSIFHFHFFILLFPFQRFAMESELYPFFVCLLHFRLVFHLTLPSYRKTVIGSVSHIHHKLHSQIFYCLPFLSIDLLHVSSLFSFAITHSLTKIHFLCVHKISDNGHYR